ncbi:MAG: AsmA-like C-terminal region-containing protein [Pseudomonadota bacterium]
MSDTGTTSDEQDTLPPRRSRLRRIGYALLSMGLVVLILLAILFATVPGRSLPVPAFLAKQVEAGLAEGLGQGQLSMDRAEIVFDRSGSANVLLRDLAVRDPGGAKIAQITEVAARIPVGALVGRDATPSRLTVRGAQITLRRGRDGQFSLQFGGGETAQAGNFGEILDLIDTVFSQKPLSEVRRITVEDVTITLEDARSGQIWQATNSSAELRNDAEAIDLTVFSEVFNGTENLALLEMAFSKTKGAAEADIAIALENAAAADIAQQSPALTVMSVIDAPVSGAIHAHFGEAGTLDGFSAALEISAGAIRPAGTVEPIAFDQGRASLSYEAAAQKLTFDEVAFESDLFRFSAAGQAFLREFSDGWPGALVAQLGLTDIEAAPEGLFTAPVRFANGRADLRLRLDPFQLDLPQVVLQGDGTVFRGHGTATAGLEGWDVAVDVSSDALTPSQVMELWPVAAVPGTRNWLTKNLSGGVLSGLSAAVRLSPNTKPRVGVTFAFDGAQVQFMEHMPPIAAASGHAALHQDTFSLRTTGGTVTPAAGGALDIAGTTICISGLARKPQRMDVGLRAAGPLEAALVLLDNRPFEILQKSGFDAEAVDATAVVEAEIGFDLLKQINVTDVEYLVTGTLNDVRSNTLVPNRVLSADRLALAVAPGQVEVEGPARLDGLSLDVSVTQPFGPEKLPAQVEGQIELSQTFLDTFGIGLPPGTVGGLGVGDFTLELPSEGAAPRFALTSDLGGMTMSIAPLSWSKAAGTLGELNVVGQLGPNPQIDALSLEALGLSAEGRIRLGAGGTFEVAEFDRIATGRWLDATLQLEARGEGRPPLVRVTGGRADLRARPEGGDGGVTGPPVPMSVALDAIRVTEAITINDLRADLVATRGLSGDFAGTVNGGAPVRGSLVTQAAGTAFRVQGDDAGRVLRDARVFQSLDGGALDLTLQPRGPGQGFNGRIRVTDTRLRNQSALVDLLDAVSIVGLLDQLQGPGIVFETVDADFRLLPDRLILDSAAAQGASLGISMDGVYALQTNQLDMQGVISPIYLLNQVGQVFTRSGEGLFGFTFRMTGNASGPTISVNPLSILTPGMFREIFRRDPPSASQ